MLSIGATYLAAEAAFSFVGLRYVPLRLQADLPDDVSVFAQSSKAGVVPRDPVLLLGDTYAHGYGDWLLEADPDRNGPFHSAHVIHSISNRDVVTLGVSGAGSAEGMAAFPAIAYARAERAWYLRLPLPHVVVIYFYEGNDLNNNLTFLESRAENPDSAESGYPRLICATSAYAFFPTNAKTAGGLLGTSHMEITRQAVKDLDNEFFGITNLTKSMTKAMEEIAQANADVEISARDRPQDLPPLQWV